MINTYQPPQRYTASPHSNSRPRCTLLWPPSRPGGEDYPTKRDEWAICKLSDMLLNLFWVVFFNVPFPLFPKNHQHFCIRFNLSEKYGCFIWVPRHRDLTKDHFSLLSIIHYTEVSVDPLRWRCEFTIDVERSVVSSCKPSGQCCTLITLTLAGDSMKYCWHRKFTRGDSGNWNSSLLQGYRCQ